MTQYVPTREQCTKAVNHLVEAAVTDNHPKRLNEIAQAAAALGLRVEDAAQPGEMSVRESAHMEFVHDCSEVLHVVVDEGVKHPDTAWALRDILERARALAAYVDKPIAARPAAMPPREAALVEALHKLEEAEHFNANCEECGGEGVPELCRACFPLFDDARVMRRNALALYPLPEPSAGDEQLEPERSEQAEQQRTDNGQFGVITRARGEAGKEEGT